MIVAINRRAEAEFLKTMTVVNAIITGCNSVVAAVNKSSEGASSDALNKSLDALKSVLLPHWAEENEARAGEAKKKLMEEMNKGPLKFQVMSNNKKKRRG